MSDLSPPPFQESFLEYACVKKKKSFLKLDDLRKLNIQDDFEIPVCFMSVQLTKDQNMKGIHPSNLSNNDT